MSEDLFGGTGRDAAGALAGGSLADARPGRVCRSPSGCARAPWRRSGPASCAGRGPRFAAWSTAAADLGGHLGTARYRQDHAGAPCRRAPGAAVRRAVRRNRRCQGRPRGGGQGPRDRDRRQTVLFLDEVHRFTKTQQDALLPAWRTGWSCSSRRPPRTLLLRDLPAALPLAAGHSASLSTDDDIAELVDRAWPTRAAGGRAHAGRGRPSTSSGSPAVTPGGR